jgi:ribokinase
MGEMKAKWDVVVMGGINTDYVVRSAELPAPGQTVFGEAFYTGPGGKGANQAVAAARLGARVAMIGRVGDEPRGRDMVRSLKREGIDVRHIGFDSKQPSGAAAIAVDAEGEKQISAALCANYALTPKLVREAEDLIASARVLLCNFETPPQCALAAAKLAKKHGVKVVLDPAPPSEVPADLFPLLYIIRPNSDEAEHMTGVNVKDRASARRAGEKLRAMGAARCVIAAGGGNLLVSEEGEIYQPHLPVKAVDATGAGDAFAAALAVGTAEGLAIREVMLLATATAGLSTTKLGAQEAMPARAEVDRCLRKLRA